MTVEQPMHPWWRSSNYEGVASLLRDIESQARHVRQLVSAADWSCSHIVLPQDGRLCVICGSDGQRRLGVYDVRRNWFREEGYPNETYDPNGSKAVWWSYCPDSPAKGIGITNPVKENADEEV